MTSTTAMLSTLATSATSCRRLGRPSAAAEPPYTWWADFDGSGAVDFGDFGYFVTAFGKAFSDPALVSRRWPWPVLGCETADGERVADAFSAPTSASRPVAKASLRLPARRSARAETTNGASLISESSCLWRFEVALRIVAAPACLGAHERCELCLICIHHFCALEQHLLRRSLAARHGDNPRHRWRQRRPGLHDDQLADATAIDHGSVYSSLTSGTHRRSRWARGQSGRRHFQQRRRHDAMGSACDNNVHVCGNR